MKQNISSYYISKQTQKKVTNLGATTMKVTLSYDRPLINLIMQLTLICKHVICNIMQRNGRSESSKTFRNVYI